MMKMRMSEVFAKEVAGRKSRLRRFYREEDGSLIVMSLFLLVAMMIFTGIAIDLERGEERRTVIQATLDRATLAAADLDQSMPPAEVVNDYMKKAGLSYLDVVPVVEEGEHGEYRRVTAQVTDHMPTMFGALTHMDSVASNSKSQAVESIGNVEVSMVLDVSGSMGQRDSNSSSNKSKIQSLRTAADSFVDDLFEKVQPPSAPEGRLSISIVPYNQQVSIGDDLAKIYNLSDDHTQNTCVDVETLDFNDLAISTTDTLPRTMFGSGRSSNETTSSYSSSQNCWKRNYSSVMAFQNDKTELKNKINSLGASGNTSIDIGAKWGLALLDPSAQPVAEQLAKDDLIDNSVDNRPFDYPTPDTPVKDTSLKVMILMTDGENTSTYSTKMAYRTGYSDFFSTYSGSSNAISTYGTPWEKLYWRSKQREDEGRSDIYYRFKTKKWMSENDIVGSKNNTTLHHLTWQNVWGGKRNLKWIAKKFLAPANYKLNSSRSEYSWYSKLVNEMAVQDTSSLQDANLAKACTAAKAKGIKIFTIALSAPTRSKNLLASCSSGPTYAYVAGTSDLTDTFASISSAISSLRLTN